MIWMALFVWLLPIAAHATTHTAAACNGSADHTKVQTAVDAATNGDLVQIPAGNCTFSGTVTWTNKSITVQGSGEASTIITATTGQAFEAVSTTTAGWRITALQVNSDAGSQNGLFIVSGSAASGVVPGRFRIDHITTTITGSATAFESPRIINVHGLVYGVCDHLTFTVTGGVEADGGVPVFVEHAANTAADGALTGSVSVSLPLDLGGDTAVYVEDSVFVTDSYGGINDSSAGGRMVLRHNSFTGPFHLQTHSTRYGDYGGFKSEYYNNVHDANFNLPSEYPGTANIISGTGVMFNTTVKNALSGDNDYQKGLYLYFQRCPNGGCTESAPPLNTCGVATIYDGDIEATGWPCLNQPGRGGGAIGSEASVPVYFWNVGSADGCATGSGCNNDYHVSLNCDVVEQAKYIKSTAHSNGDIDYCEGGSTMPTSCGNHTNTYVPYTYPHPLIAGGGSSTPGGMDLF